MQVKHDSELRRGDHTEITEVVGIGNEWHGNAKLHETTDVGGTKGTHTMARCSLTPATSATSSAVTSIYTHVYTHTNIRTHTDMPVAPACARPARQR